MKAGAQREEQGGRGQQRPGRQLQLLQLSLLQSLGLGPAVLRPDLDLRLGETEAAGERGARREGQVLPLTEPALQRQQLRGGEGRPLPAVALLFPEGAGWTWGERAQRGRSDALRDRRQGRFWT